MPNIAYLDFYYEKISTVNKIYDNALVLTALEDDTVFNINVSGITVQLNISYDNGMTWTPLTLTSGYELDAINAGDNIMITGTNEHSLQGLSFDTDDNATFTVSGNIMTLLDAENYKTMTTIDYDYCFASLFEGSAVADATYLSLPATTIPEFCYAYMFKDCTSLVNPPSLPATTIDEYCYREMFSGCTSLATAPSLPATTLALACYIEMFYDCSSLTIAPKLPATTLAAYCYYEMFRGCSSLTVAPVLPATTLAQRCYAYMFSGCTSLVNPPELPATTLEPSCYEQMFRGCTSIVNAPTLPATTLTTNCYMMMFDGCTHLNYIKVLAVEGPNGETNLANYCTLWVQNVAATGIFIKDANANFIVDSASGIPVGWTVYNIGEVIVHQFDITLNIDPAGTGAVYGGGLYDLGQMVTLVATPAEGYIFDGWYYDDVLQDTRSTWSFTPLYDPEVGYDLTYTAKFVVDPTVYYNVTLTQDPDIGATLVGAGRYAENTMVTVSASQAQGYNFLGWYADDQVLTENYNFVFMITEDTPLTAKYQAIVPPTYYTVTTNVEPTAAGTVTGGGQYLAGDFATINAYPASGYNFEYWMQDGQIVTYDTSYTFEVNYNTTFSAVFSIVLGYENDYLTFESILSGNNSIYVEMPSNIYFTSASIEYSYNNGRWNTITLSQNNNYIMTLKNSDTIRFRNYVCTKIGSYDFNPHFHFGDCNVYGNILSLYHDHIDFNNSTDKYYFGLDDTTLLPGEQFSLLFEDCYIVDAHNLKLTATTLTEYCYSSMFHNCRELVLAPALPATTLAPYCYLRMFEGCISLTNSPVLPATTVTNYCYADMFMRCTSLVHPPALPATTLAEYCYYYMFWGCTSLTNPPALPATALAHSCYKYMFQQCTSLVNAPALPATNLAYYCYDSMFQQCTSLVNAPALPATTVPVHCYDSMFQQCTSLVNAPALPATTLYEGCYISMFEGCTSLTNPPALPATTLATQCYKWMFNGCTALHNITCLATDIGAIQCTTEWVKDVASSGTFTKAASMSTWTTGRNGIPSGWTVQDAS